MSERTRLGLWVLLLAAILGALNDGLLRATPWGLNVAICALAVALAIVALEWARGRVELGCRWLLVPAVLFGAGFAWRDSAPLKALDFLAVSTLLALAVVPGAVDRLRRSGLTDYAVATALAGVNALFGAFLLLLNDVRWREIPKEGWSGYGLAVGRGLALALPLVLLFGLLFAAADAAFAGIVSVVLGGLRLEEIISHLILTACLAWAFGGYLRSAAFANGSPGAPRAPATAPILSLGSVEIGIVLGLLDALFLAFVVVQFRYFFGGASLVETTATLTYAEYARRGFFELVTVVALVLPLLLLLHWLLRRHSRRDEWIFRALAGAQIALLFVIMVSALQRMRLYQAEYGQTELRVYTTAFMGWLALVCLWFSVTVLRGRREAFAIGALAAGCLAIAALHALNPDAYIVDVHAERARAGKAFDARYATSLSADAVPSLIAALPSLNPADRMIVEQHLRRRLAAGEPADWRTWNWSRAEARRALEAGATGRRLAESELPVR